MRMTRWSMMVLTVWLAGCASQPQAPVTAAVGDFKVKIRCGASVAPEQQVELEVVDTLTNQQRPYAALANLQKQRQTNQEYWRRYGQLLAQTGDLERASHVFDELRSKCKSGEAWQGAGIVALHKGDVERARVNLERAVNLSPAVASVRNDYGYVLLLSGQHDAAVQQLRTALELQNGNGRARQNLATAYVMGNNHAGLDQLREQYRFTDEEFEYARKLASDLRKLP